MESSNSFSSTYGNLVQFFIRNVNKEDNNNTKTKMRNTDEIKA